MTFTPEQIEAIEQIVDRRIEALGRKKPPLSPKRYHTVPEIRGLINYHFESLVEWFGDDEFDIAVLRHFLSRKTQLREGDLEIPNPHNQNVTRWDAQVLAAINLATWPESPIVPSLKRRLYRLNRNAQIF